jgi:hypothetical protein
MAYNITFTDVSVVGNVVTPIPDTVTSYQYNATVVAAPGADGQDGVSITDVEIDGNGDLLVTMSNSAVINAGQVSGGAMVDWGNVAITGGTINGTLIGNTSAAAAVFTDLTAATIDSATMNGGYF